MQDMCILVVDDDSRIVRFLRSDLMNRGYEVVTAATGESAMAILRGKPPDIMLIDMYLPGKNGFEVISELRTFSKIPVIAFSADGSVSRVAINLGANAFISKPFSLDDLADKVAGLLSSDTRE